MTRNHLLKSGYEKRAVIKTALRCFIRWIGQLSSFTIEARKKWIGMQSD